MSKLDAFLNPVTIEETREVVVSDRFKDEDGKPVPFKIKSITQAQNNKLIKSCTRTSKDRTGVISEQFDKVDYNRKLVLACVVEPDLQSAELCTAYGVVDPAEVAERMLLSGEYACLMEEIMNTNGFNTQEVYEEAKNS